MIAQILTTAAQFGLVLVCLFGLGVLLVLVSSSILWLRKRV